MFLSYSELASHVYITYLVPENPFPSENFSKTLSVQFGDKEHRLYIRQTYVLILAFFRWDR